MIDSTYIKYLKSSLKSLPKDFREVLHEILTVIPIPVLISDEKQNIVSVNKSFIKQTQLKAEKITGTKLNSLFISSPDLFRKAFKRLENQEKTEIKAIELVNSREEIIIGSASVSSIKKKSRRMFILCFSGLQLKNNELLFRETSFFDEYLNTISGRGKWLLNTKTRLFSGNNICFDLLGLKNKNGVIDFNEFLALISNQEEKDDLEKDIFKIIDSPQIIEREIRLKNEDSKSGTKTIKLIFNSLINMDEVLIAGSIEDISNYKRIEKELFRSKSRIEKSNRFKTVFLNNLSHEIRTPMNSILGYGELLNQNNLQPEKIREYTSIIKAKGNYLLTLIDDVIELSRFESGNINFNYTEFELYPLLNELYKEFDSKRIKNGQKSISLLMDLPDNAKEQLIYTDYGRLQQLLSNLLSNALKFTERGEISFGYSLSSKNFKFFVRDTGVGLTREDQSKIFNRFEIPEETTVKKLSGTGLNLTISKHIVEQLGGKIKVKSELGKGSRFQLNLPISSPNNKQQSQQAEDDFIHRYNWKDKVVVVAEDEDINFKFLDAVLQKTQAQVLRARNGQEAVDLCKKINQIDIVLMDIKMPVMNGYDATIEIKRYRTNLPIIAQTAFSSREEILKSQQVGLDDFISKPIDIKDLLEKINSLFLR